MLKHFHFTSTNKYPHRNWASNVDHQKKKKHTVRVSDINTVRLHTNTHTHSVPLIVFLGERFITRKHSRSSYLRHDRVNLHMSCWLADEGPRSFHEIQIPSTNIFLKEVLCKTQVRRTPNHWGHLDLSCYRGATYLSDCMSLFRTEV